MIDDNEIHRSCLRFEFQSELFLHSLQERRSRIVGSEIHTRRQWAVDLRRPFHEYIVGSRESRPVQYGAIYACQRATEQHCKHRHGHISRRSDDDVKTALEELPDAFRMAVLLADVEGFSYKEISEITEVPIGTVMSRIHRGRRALQKALHDVAEARGLVGSVPGG